MSDAVSISGVVLMSGVALMLGVALMPGVALMYGVVLMSGTLLLPGAALYVYLCANAHDIAQARTIVGSLKEFMTGLEDGCTRCRDRSRACISCSPDVGVCSR